MAVSRFDLEQMYAQVVVRKADGLPRGPFVWSGAVAPLIGLTELQLRQAILNAGDHDRMVMPLRMKLAGESEFWTLPAEPMLSISGGNVIIRRNVAKTGESGDIRGSVKERWTTDDYTLTIEGMLRNWGDDAQFPRADVERLRGYCEARQVIQVECPMLEIFNITQMVIESFEFPFTKGEDMQAYSIGAYSDSNFELLIENTLR